MAFACLASLAIFAGGLAAWSTIMWYKGSRGPRDRKKVRKAVKKEPKEALEQLA
jgi:hypothetical protein